MGRCHQGGEKDIISLMNTQITLAPALSTNKAARTIALAYHFTVFCVWGGSRLRETVSEPSLRLLFWVPGSLWYAITSTWSEWWIEAWLRPPHFVSPEKGLRFLTMETVSTSPKQPLNLCICLTHFSPFPFVFENILMLLGRNFCICQIKFPEVSLLFTVNSPQRFLANVVGLTQRLKSSSSSNSSSSSSSLSTSDTP